jgi:hypothetical protein
MSACLSAARERAFHLREILRMNVVAGLNRDFGAADALSVPVDVFAWLDMHQRHLMPGRNIAANRKFVAFDAQSLAGGERHARYRNVVTRMKVYRRVLGSRELLNLK